MTDVVTADPGLHAKLFEIDSGGFSVWLRMMAGLGGSGWCGKLFI